MRRSARSAIRRRRSARWAACGRAAPCRRGRCSTGYQVERLPAPSTARNWSSVSPSAVIAAGLPDEGDAPGRPAVGRAAVLVAGDAAARGVGRAGRGDADRRGRQPGDRSAGQRGRGLRRGAVDLRGVRGARRGRHPGEKLPAPSTLRSCTSVEPSGGDRERRAGRRAAPAAAVVGRRPVLVVVQAGAAAVARAGAADGDLRDVLPAGRAAADGRRGRQRAVEAHGAPGGRRGGHPVGHQAGGVERPELDERLALGGDLRRGSRRPGSPRSSRRRWTGGTGSRRCRCPASRSSRSR